MNDSLTSSLNNLSFNRDELESLKIDDSLHTISRDNEPLIETQSHSFTHELVNIQPQPQVIESQIINNYQNSPIKEREQYNAEETQHVGVVSKLLSVVNITKPKQKVNIQRFEPSCNELFITDCISSTDKESKEERNNNTEDGNLEESDVKGRYFTFRSLQSNREHKLIDLFNIKEDLSITYNKFLTCVNDRNQQQQNVKTIINNFKEFKMKNKN